MYQEVTRLLQTLPHGPYQAIVQMVGEQQARHLTGEMRRELIMPDSEYNIPPQPNDASTSGERPAKRQRRGESIETIMDVELSE